MKTKMKETKIKKETKTKKGTKTTKTEMLPKMKCQRN